MGQSTRDTFPLLSLGFFHLAYFCLFCLFLHLKDLDSCAVQKGPDGGGAAFQGVDLLLFVRCFCNYIPEIPIEERSRVIIGLTIPVNFDYSFVIISELLP